MGAGVIRFGGSAAAVVVILTGAGAVPAEARFRSCPSFLPGSQCDRVTVALDHSGRVSGSVGLHVVRLRAERPTRRAMVYLSGGPGGTATQEFLSALADEPIRDLRSTHHLATFDQRGTGRSGLLRCPALERDPRLRSTTAGEDCAARIGPRRAFYTTRESVEDLDDVRQALGVDRLFLYGVSYGTKLALAYARTYPARVERLLLDSVADPDDADPFGLEPLRAIPDTLRTLCPEECRTTSANPGEDLRTLVARLRDAPMSARIRVGSRRVTRTLTPVAIADLLFDADYAPELRSGVPAAVRSALQYANAAPLLRLIEAARPLSDTGRPQDFSSARYATVCEETALPWARGTAFEERLPEARRRAAELGPTAFGPFDFEVARADEIDLCLRWPEAAEAPVLAGAGGRYPAVPALVLQGGEDLRTPPEASRRVASMLPFGRRVLVPGVGHAVLGSDPSGCAQRQLRKWLAGRSVATRCGMVETGVPVAPVLPSRFSEVRPAQGLSGRISQTVSAVSLTLEDLGFALSPAFSVSPSDHGLVGGSFSLGRRGLRLRRFEVISGVWLDGVASSSGVLRVRVGGTAASRGSVVITPGGKLRGRLSGKRVRARLLAGLRPRASAARRVRRPSVRVFPR
jgi:pimeloyl-ACP methyl ester carboxylesterase